MYVPSNTGGGFLGSTQPLGEGNPSMADYISEDFLQVLEVLWFNQ